MATRNYLYEELEFEIWKDAKFNNSEDGYEETTEDDIKFEETTISIKIDNEGNGETTFIIPANWKNYQTTVAQFFYFKEKESGVEFPRAYYIVNPNTKEPETKQNKEKKERKKQNSNRIIALMLKVSSSKKSDTLTETNNAAILGDELTGGERENKDSKCECEARVRAYMRMIRIGEGTPDESGYTRIVGGSSFSDNGKDMSDHPKVYIKKHNSTAAGAYQITKTNWNDQSFVNWRKQKKLTDFSKESQDKYCVYLIISKKKAFKLIKNGDIKGAISKCSKEWASLPGAGYGQREESLNKILKEYNNFLKEELEEKTTLHIKKGFLKELYGYTCCNNKLTGIKSSNKEGYDIEKAVAHVNSNAEPKSKSKCALYVREGINAGGIGNIYGHAKEYYGTDKLVKYGFTKIGTDIDSITLVKGDIAAFAAVKGHSYGHIAMYNGSQWVSDFKQKSFWVANQYKIEKKYAIYRWK